MNLSYRNSKNADFMAKYWNKPLDKPEWYKIEAKSDDEPAELMIDSVIGWPYIDVGVLARELSAMKSRPVIARINSCGGDVWSGLQLFNILQSHPGGVSVVVEGLAASIASIVMLAGKKVEAYPNSMFMVHEPWTIAAGNQFDFAEIGAVLSKISGNMVDIYSQESKMGKRESRESMKAETWYTAKEALEKGLIDNILDGKGAKAEFDLSMFAKIPDELKSDPAPKEEPDIRSIERLLREAGGLSRNKAKELLARGWPAEKEESNTGDIESTSPEIIQWDDSIVARLRLESVKYRT